MRADITIETTLGTIVVRDILGGSPSTSSSGPSPVLALVRPKVTVTSDLTSRPLAIVMPAGEPAPLRPWVTLGLVCSLALVALLLIRAAGK